MEWSALLEHIARRMATLAACWPPVVVPTSRSASMDGHGDA